MKFTFGIVTIGNDAYVEKVINSIVSQNIPEYEIIVVGACSLQSPNLQVIPFDETVKTGWITRKKNIITELASFDNIVYLHDYIYLGEGWYEGQLKAGDDFAVRIDRTINFDGTRAGDWLLCVWGSEFVASLIGNTMACLLPYHIGNLSKHMYASGSYFIAKKSVMKEFPFDESRSWGESDDVEWSKRLRERYEFSINTNSTVHFLKQKDMPFVEPTGDLLYKIEQLNNRMSTNKQNKFVIVTPSYNNEEWVEYNLASILNQTYTNYEVVYIDDASTDNTYNAVTAIVGDLPNWRVIKNEENKGASYNYVDRVAELNLQDDDIIIHLDGDDWLIDDEVLEKLNAFYNERDCWMTYGGFVCWDGTEETKLPYPQSTPYPKFVHDHKLYRQDMWRASHLRTFRHFLWNKIRREDLVSRIDNQLYWHASDLSWQYPCMEMCTEERVGVVDFFTCVYNQSKSNTIRTQEREHQDNAKYEVEIRNKKKYKSGLSGERLPQVNVFNKDYYFEYNNIPTKFSYCYEQEDGEFDMTVLCDPAILDYLDGKITIKRKAPLVARLFEQREYFQRNIYNAIIENHHKFDEVWTFDRELLAQVPNAKFLPPTEVTQFNRLPNPHGHEPYKSPAFETYELPREAFQMYPKTKSVSAIVSTKAFLPGHVKRLNFVRAIQHKIDLFGRGIQEIPSKLDGLRDYRFSVAIENISCDDNYFSEKIIDCFLTGTIPIYHGCIHIHEFFDQRGILSFQTQEELDNIIDSLTPELYESMLPYAEENYRRCFDWPLDNDMLFDSFYKKAIENGTTI